MIRLILADDHTIFREGILRLLDGCADIDVVAQACDGNEVLQCVKNHAADVLLTDLSMPGRHGLDLIKALRSHVPELPILVLSMHPEEQFAPRLIKAGARGYLSKTASSEEVIKAVKRVASGGTYLSPEAAQQFALGMMMDGGDLPHQRLSDREYEIFLKLANGSGVTELANELHLSAKTVSTHKTRIMEKLGVENLSQLVRYALEHELMEG